MPAELKINDGGTWRNAASVYVKDGGTWRTIQDIKINDAGTWRTVYQAFTITGSPSAWSIFDTQASGDPAYAALNVNSDGTISTDGGVSVAGSANWGSPTTPGIGASYWVKFTPTSGTFDGNMASGWTTLSSAESCWLSNTFGTYSCTFTIQIATDALGSNVVFTSTGNVLTLNHV